jgi:threonine/homoserine/homoserine lactone efflux protein
MLEIILYAVGVMYTPGPVNFIGLNSGIQKQSGMLGFFVGVSTGMTILFLAVSFVGAQLISDTLLQWSAALGTACIVWLSYKIFRSDVSGQWDEKVRPLAFADGVLMQILNPKGFSVALPLATVQFPAAGITGGSLVAWSVGLAFLGLGAPSLYYGCGRLLGRRIYQASYLKWINRLMAVFLLFVAVNMGMVAFSL